MTNHDVQVDCYGLTDVGKVRRVNEDQFLIASMRKVMEIEQSSLPSDTREQMHGRAMARLLLVADGVGGSAAGEEASGLALETVATYVTTTMKCFYQLDKQLESDLLSELEHSVQQSHAMVQSAAESTPERQGMATTLTVVHVLWPTAYIVHVGDSRCYLFRDLGLTQLTRDQTLAQDLVERGVLAADRADDSEWSDLLSGAVGARIAPDTSKVELRRGDTLLLCTDGLTKHLKTDHITDVLRVAESAESACHKLVTNALERGGTDNVTVVVGRFT
jgi:protein phosphatase